MHKSFAILIALAIVVVLAFLCVIFVTAYTAEANNQEHTVYMPFVQASPWGNADCRHKLWEPKEDCQPMPIGPWIEGE